ncbi:Slp family lipoprotein [Granulosicoccus antarcticus]|uniref:Outer membrane protein slp n=1 Tax=Granulosicoccus antarcticus IMCC3135 TaxID=1192854 RepID=A0A2Z2NNF3_9GAMM|nr:Slp family lipoprotein [Granulosicoccus antarcticus]ASJ71268.1 Outer membrane protein slp [Granulosicoccus antarcticus IMCC3135]
MIRSKTTVAVLVLGSWLASACAISNPAPPAEGGSVTDITVAQARDDEGLALSVDAASSPSVEAASIVRWGGTITRVLNRADNTTLVEIVSRPLYSGGRPIHDDRSDGRFLAEIDEFLDPQIVEAGRDMTVLGGLSERRVGKIGEAEYLFPVVAVQSYKYWKEMVVVPASHFPHWNRYPSYGRNDPLWRDWPFNPDSHPSRR